MSKFNIDDGDFSDDIKGSKNNDMNNENNNGNEVKEKEAAKK